MNQFEQKVVRALREFYVLMRGGISKEILRGQAIHRTRRMHRQAELARQVRIALDGKARWGKEKCTCGEDHRVVEITNGNGVVLDAVCPHTWWFRQLQAMIHQGKDSQEVNEWLGTHRWGCYEKSLEAS